MTAPLTGRKVLAIAVTFFGVIFLVNFFMAYKAVGTFPGLEVKNSYVASQSFDRDRAAQEALGWTLEAAYRDGHLLLDFRDSAGRPAPVAQVSALVGRTTSRAEDFTPEFIQLGSVYEAPASLGHGKWMMQLEAFAEDGTRFHQRIDLFVRE
jgi:nitrogen fixation protein FixH